MPIKTFRITNAGPFEDITFEFDEHVNVFVGPNNSGKSTALLALAEASVYPFEFPSKFIKGSGSEWQITLNDGNEFNGVLPAALIDQPGYVGPLPNIGFSTFVPSLRRSTDYRSKGPSTSATDHLSVVDLPQGSGFNDPELRKRRRLMATDAALVSDESVIQKWVDLDYAGYRRKQHQIHWLLKKVACIASKITEGYSLEFLRIGEDDRGLLFPEFKTPDGDLPLNVLSQGTQSTLQWLAHFLFSYAQYYDYPENLAEESGILIIDEIDVHLHPSWQRRIIPALTNNFPNLQIFCSTHSPLMLTGLGEGQVQLLNRDEDGKVTVSRNRWDMAGWSAEQILRSVLGVRDTMDLTTASEIDRMGELSLKTTLSETEKAELEQIRERIGQLLPGGPASSLMESFLRFLREVYSEKEGSSARKRPRVRRRNSEAE